MVAGVQAIEPALMLSPAGQAALHGGRRLNVNRTFAIELARLANAHARGQAGP